MQRYFTTNINIETKQAFLKENDFHHVKNVMRMKKQDELIVCNNNNVCFKGVITDFTNDEVIIELINELENIELPVRIDLAQALIRRERFEYVLQKATELGVHTIHPVFSTHSIVHLDSKKAHKKIERWNKITKEASEQSHRNHLVTVSNVVKGFNKLDLTTYDQIIVAYEKEKNSKELKTVLSNKVKNILLIIGPEGGLHQNEIEELSKQATVSFVGLGKRILRSETASSYLLSVLGYHYEIGDNK